MNPTHTVNNAVLCAAALHYGGLDPDRSICLAVSGGLDTDCNGATAGSVLGIMLGAKRLPTSWTGPLCDTLISGVDGFGKVRISELAARTEKMMRRKFLSY